MILLAEFSGWNGFLGTRASLMLDVVFLAMLVIVPVMLWGIRLAKRGAHAAHKRVQLTLALILLVAVSAFEIDMRVNTDWRERAAASPYYSPSGMSAVWTSLIVHLGFAVPTLLVWIGVVTAALRRFPRPPHPGPHSATHRRWGWIASVLMTLTSVTGWVFYWLAFVAA